MNERLEAMSDHELGAVLTELTDRLDWPATPDVAAPVGDAIRALDASPSSTVAGLGLPSRRRLVLVAAAVVLALAATALAARLVTELGAITVRVAPGRPTSLPTDVAARGNLGIAVTLEEASAIAGFLPVVPPALGPPDRAWVDEARVDPESEQTARRIVTAWPGSSSLPPISGTRRGAVLMQFEGEWEVASKLLFAETDRFGTAFVDGRQAFWTSGEHELALVTGERSRRYLVTGTVLIWQDAGFTFRLETALPKARAIAIAESIEPAAFAPPSATVEPSP